VQEKLLDKFPEFDPAWDQELQKKWFDGFERFLAVIKKTEPEDKAA
jgi:hypothetical protein